MEDEPPALDQFTSPEAGPQGLPPGDPVIIFRCETEKNRAARKDDGPHPGKYPAAKRPERTCSIAVHSSATSPPGRKKDKPADPGNGPMSG